MLIEFLRCARTVLSRYAESPAAASEILNDLYGSALKAYGVGRIVVSGREQVTLKSVGTETAEYRGENVPCRWIEIKVERGREAFAHSTP